MHKELDKFAFLVLKDNRNVAKLVVEEWLKVIYGKVPCATLADPR